MMIVCDGSIFIEIWLRLFFLNISFFLIIEALVNGDIHFFNKNTISRNSVSLVQIDYISYNKLLNWNWRCLCSSKTNYSLGVDFFLKLKILSFLNPITNGGHETCKTKPNVNCKWFYKSSCIWTKARNNQINGGTPNEQNDCTVFELPSSKCHETINFWHSNFVFTICLLSSFNIFDVTDNAAVWVSTQKLA